MRDVDKVLSYIWLCVDTFRKFEGALIEDCKVQWDDEANAQWYTFLSKEGDKDLPSMLVGTTPSRVVEAMVEAEYGDLRSSLDGYFQAAFTVSVVNYPAVVAKLQLINKELKSVPIKTLEVARNYERPAVGNVLFDGPRLQDIASELWNALVDAEEICNAAKWQETSAERHIVSTEQARLEVSDDGRVVKWKRDADADWEQFTFGKKAGEFVLALHELKEQGKLPAPNPAILQVVKGNTSQNIANVIFPQHKAMTRGLIRKEGSGKHAKWYFAN